MLYLGKCYMALTALSLATELISTAPPPRSPSMAWPTPHLTTFMCVPSAATTLPSLWPPSPPPIPTMQSHSTATSPTMRTTPNGTSATASTSTLGLSAPLLAMATSTHCTSRRMAAQPIATIPMSQASATHTSTLLSLTPATTTTASIGAATASQAMIICASPLRPSPLCLREAAASPQVSAPTRFPSTGSVLMVEASSMATPMAGQPSREKYTSPTPVSTACFSPGQTSTLPSVIRAPQPSTTLLCDAHPVKSLLTSLSSRSTTAFMSLGLPMAMSHNGLSPATTIV